MNGLFSQFSVFSALSGLFARLGGATLTASLADSTTLQNMPGEADFAAIMGNLLTSGTASSASLDASQTTTPEGLSTALQGLLAGTKVVSTTLNTTASSRNLAPVSTELTEDSASSSVESILDPNTLAYIVLPTPVQVAQVFQAGEFSLNVADQGSLPVALVVEKGEKNPFQGTPSTSPADSQSVLRLVVASGSEGLSATRETRTSPSLETHSSTQWPELGLDKASTVSGSADPVEVIGYPSAGGQLEDGVEEIQSFPPSGIRISHEAIQELITYGETTVAFPVQSASVLTMDSPKKTQAGISSTTYQVTVPAAVLRLAEGLETSTLASSQPTLEKMPPADKSAVMNDSSTSSSGLPAPTTGSSDGTPASVRVLLGKVASYLSDLHGEITSIQSVRKDSPAPISSVLPVINTVAAPAVFTRNTTVPLLQDPVTLPASEKSNTTANPVISHVVQMAEPQASVTTGTAPLPTTAVSLKESLVVEPPVSLISSVSKVEGVKAQTTPAGQGTTPAPLPISQPSINTASTTFYTESVAPVHMDQPVRVLQILAIPTVDTEISGVSTKSTYQVSRPVQADSLSSNNYALPSNGESFSIRDGIFVIKGSTPPPVVEPAGVTASSPVHTTVPHPVGVVPEATVSQVQTQISPVAASGSVSAGETVVTVMKSTSPAATASVEKTTASGNPPFQARETTVRQATPVQPPVSMETTTSRIHPVVNDPRPVAPDMTGTLNRVSVGEELNLKTEQVSTPVNTTAAASQQPVARVKNSPVVFVSHQPVDKPNIILETGTQPASTAASSVVSFKIPAPSPAPVAQASVPQSPLVTGQVLEATVPAEAIPSQQETDGVVSKFTVSPQETVNVTTPKVATSPVDVEHIQHPQPVRVAPVQHEIQSQVTNWTNEPIPAATVELAREVSPTIRTKEAASEPAHVIVKTGLEDNTIVNATKISPAESTPQKTSIPASGGDSVGEVLNAQTTVSQLRTPQVPVKSVLVMPAAVQSKTVQAPVIHISQSSPSGQPRTEINVSTPSTGQEEQTGFQMGLSASTVKPDQAGKTVSVLPRITRTNPTPSPAVPVVVTPEAVVANEPATPEFVKEVVESPTVAKAETTGSTATPVETATTKTVTLSAPVAPRTEPVQPAVKPVVPSQNETPVMAQPATVKAETTITRTGQPVQVSVAPAPRTEPVQPAAKPVVQPQNETPVVAQAAPVKAETTVTRTGQPVQVNVEPAPRTESVQPAAKPVVPSQNEAPVVAQAAPVKAETTVTRAGQPVQVNVEPAPRTESVQPAAKPVVPSQNEAPVVAQAATVKAETTVTRVGQPVQESVAPTPQAESVQPAVKPVVSSQNETPVAAQAATVKAETTVTRAGQPVGLDVNVPVETEPRVQARETMPTATKVNVSPEDVRVETAVRGKEAERVETQVRTAQVTLKNNTLTSGVSESDSEIPEILAEVVTGNTPKTKTRTAKPGLEPAATTAQVQTSPSSTTVERNATATSQITVGQDAVVHEIPASTGRDSLDKGGTARTSEFDTSSQRLTASNLASVRPESAEGSTATPRADSTSTASRVVESRILEQVVEAVRVQKTSSGSEIRVRLNPDNLGEVSLKVNMTSEGLVAELSASRMATQEVLTKHAQQIQSLLVDSGLRVDQVVVKTGGMDSSPDFKGGGSQRESLPQERDSSGSSFSRERGSRDQSRGSNNPFEENGRKGWEKYA